MMGQTRRGSIEKVWPYEWHSSYPTDNKRYTKVDEYEALLVEEDSTENIKYKERLINYDKDYESYDLYLDWNGPETFY